MISEPPIHYSADVEPDEQTTIDQLEQTFATTLKKTAKDYGDTVRAVHAKAYGIVEGKGLSSVDGSAQDFIMVDKPYWNSAHFYERFDGCSSHEPVSTR